MEIEYNPWAMFHSTDMGDNLEEVVETEDCKVLRMKDPQRRWSYDHLSGF